jgi:hypothetical protein
VYLFFLRHIFVFFVFNFTSENGETIVPREATECTLFASKRL